MMKLLLSKIAELIGGSGDFDRDALVSGYSINSRTIEPRQLFFAVRGEKLDGHDFVGQALQAGAAAVVVSSDKVRGKAPAKTIIVEDTLWALQQLAEAVRRIWGKRLVAVTGSAGKTSTKEAIANVLASKFKVFRSEGNLNNHFGLPLMLLRLEAEHEIGVIELGMSHAGEIAALSKIAEPEIGVVTNVAPVHLENFDSIEGIARAKRELVEGLPADGTAILNADDRFVSKFGERFSGRVLTYGIRAEANVRASGIETRGADGVVFELRYEGAKQEVRLPLLGEHNVYNALAAAAAGLVCGLDLPEIADALATLKPAHMRGQVVQVGNIKVVNDCYNSNPKALEAMVDVLANMEARRRIVVAGEMLELGGESDAMHFACGRHIAEKKIDVLIGVRGLAREIVKGAGTAVESIFFETPEEAGGWLCRQARDGDAVLLKASRGVKLERALEAWSQKREAQAEG